ncbi:hypothetical protein EW026_g733 [Hermanssonia centrifuga]|uniref:Uncharacterized protein n=1 Tax=Hermanssonia centrifuga TaxID=98765 RepID=A0A4S4KUT7_9APHY|nr:hypothetical protein EW026_g733 [Hermanssonia centrifuga]
MDLNKSWANVRENEYMQRQPQIPGVHDMKELSGWASEFESTAHRVSAGPLLQQGTLQQPNYQQSSFMSAGMYGVGRPMGMFSPMNMQSPVPLQDSSKGKGKGREIDFEAAFAQVHEALGPSPEEMSRFEEFDDTADLSAAMERAQLKGTSDEEQLRLGTDFGEVWDSLQNSTLPPAQEDMAKWEAEYNQLMSSTRDEFDYGASMQEAWNTGTANETTIRFDDEGLPILGDYIFEKENKYLNPSASTSSYLIDAKALLDAGGSLTEAALMFEAAIQKGDLGEGGYEAWILLGEVRNMDEREEPGMRALMEGVKRAEAVGAAGEGMLSLAVSFTNESFERGSHTMLLRWLRARYPSHSISEEAWKSLSNSAWHSHERVTEAFIDLARQQHSQGQLDPEVQIGLGVLYYTNGQYELAKDCFEAALSIRPNDYLLWNRFGSCLSNGNKPEEALGAYRQALEIRPTYTRAIYNVGVACLNIGAHKEAAEHFLSALAMQDSSGTAKSDQLWFTLRRTFISMDRNDLAEKAVAGTDVDVFRREGFDF